MKLVMTLLARNEADIVDAQIAFHLHAGVDFVIATDNLSSDGTTEIFERYRDAGFLHLISEPSEVVRQEEWVTRMARMAATELGADWVINSDADEFWWPRGGSLKEVLSLVPERFGVVRGVWRHFLPIVDATEALFSERMTIRLCEPAHPRDKATIHHAHQKVAHRADPQVFVERGNHNASGRGLEPLRTWFPIEVLHFSIRSLAQLEKKAAGRWIQASAEDIVDHEVRLEDARRDGSLADLLEEDGVSTADIERGLAGGTLAVDTRLRDALRGLRSADDTYCFPTDEPSLAFPRPEVEDTAAFAAEVSILAEIDAIPRAEARAALLEARLGALRTLPRR